MEEKKAADNRISVTRTAEDLSLSDDEDYADESGFEANSSIGGSQSASTEKLNLAKRETQAVFKLRLLVFVVLSLAAVAVSIIVFLVTKNAEKDEYRNQYDAAAQKVVESFIDIVNSKLQAVSSLGVAMIAHGVDHYRQWPFVTLSSFQQRTSTARAQSGALYVHVNPMVREADRKGWEEFVVTEENYWITQGLEYQENVGLLDFSSKTDISPMLNSMDAYPIWVRDEDGVPVKDTAGAPYMPTWQTSPVYHGGATLNENLLQNSLSSKGLNASFYSSSVVIGDMLTAPPGGMDSNNSHSAMMALMLSTAHNKTEQYEGDPMSQVFFPIFNSFEDDREPVAVMVAWISWISYFQDQLPKSLQGVHVVLHSTCSGDFTYEINGEEVRYLGRGDLHEEIFDDMKQSATFESLENIGDGTKTGLPLNKDECMMSIDVYPSTKFYEAYNTSTPIVMTFVTACVFVFTVCMFLLYDRLVERRQALVMQKAVESNAIVTSLFPENVRDRLVQMNNDSKKDKEGGAFGLRQSHRLKAHLRGAEDDGSNEAPIADLFPRCTVLFADIAGFTAWSSTRSPEQVFTLLQTVYQAFDKIAKRRKVFKVETIGDSYLAVCGLPEPQPEHAIIMVKFAWDCLQKMHEVTRELECSLGPDTGDLAMRFGLHSGPVTAGVLRGERARFQLFGDTVNTASRMESTGERGKIQVSQDTADLIKESCRDHWLVPREDKVSAKGKGMLQTYWILNPTKQKDSSSFEGSGEGESRSEHMGDISTRHSISRSVRKEPKNQRLIEWMVDLLMDDVKKIVHIRRQFGQKESKTPLAHVPAEGTTCMDEVKTSIEMAKFNAKKASSFTADYSNVKIDSSVVDSLREFVGIIASKYRDNPFHNFEHACHVTMSVKKLLKRIMVAPELTPAEVAKLKKNPNNLASRLHDSTYGITSDPLAMLAISMSALIHDVDHRGVSNMQLSTEDKELGDRYSNKSVAEQNSLDLSWEILMEDRFDALRRCLFTSQAELLRFRQIVVNMVLATDIFDKELNGLRKNRWEKAFDERGGSNDSNLRATIVIEHVIQASDVSHTMQHWHVYQKWNRFLFLEMHKAYCQGRMAKDPSTFWYQGEIGFFDNYVIPLAKKLKECGVFGVSSDEYLNYAIQNRNEWEERGQSIVKGLVQEALACLEEQEV
ncbi:Receptor-type guanylate cyclase gcy [Seminavis robusta]|uniref:Receptor-type guanylate cyclase gcy n=1 Tax=Seminavis robusta TaxID=568900 RepID=A0A9N8DZJ9_9STRA|nr:Receptor-type guanylate cyclase gcy [Seminavis robusta]|eukprot:Sro478_g151020.1 Receptor-type guanylate cyclase gcy (1169) ;mRNA; f:31980-36455